MFENPPHNVVTAGAVNFPSQQVDRERLLREFDQRFRRPLTTYFRRRVSDLAEAEDLTQDVFERVLKILKVTPILNPEALVFRIAVNLLRDRSRRMDTRGLEEPLTAENIIEFADVFAANLSPERVVLAEETLSNVLASLAELPERTRSIFYLFRLENLKIRSIAEAYGISPSAVEKHVSKALLHLAQRRDNT